MKNKKILDLPIVVFVVICLVLVIGIAIGSFCDFDISSALSNKTEFGTFFQNYGNILSHCLYVVAGICIFKGLKKLGKKYNLLSVGVLVLTAIWTIQSFISSSGKYLMKAYGYVAGESGIFPLALVFLTWVAIIGLVAFLAYILISDLNPKRLICVGTVIIVGGIFGEVINDMLKLIASRPRYKYLITLDDPLSEFRNWWEMVPYLKDDTLFKSFPSAHMNKATIILTLPLLASVLKFKNKALKYIFLGFGCLWILAYGYNRIHMDAHFLTDVCFGVLIAYLLYVFTYKVVYSFSDSEEE